MGRWRLVAPRDGSVEPRVTLVAAYDNAVAFLADALAPENPPWVRAAYAVVVAGARAPAAPGAPTLAASAQ
jgi:hypothetical protein